MLTLLMRGELSSYKFLYFTITAALDNEEDPSLKKKKKGIHLKEKEKKYYRSYVDSV